MPDSTIKAINEEILLQDIFHGLEQVAPPYFATMCSEMLRKVTAVPRTLFQQPNTTRFLQKSLPKVTRILPRLCDRAESRIRICYLNQKPHWVNIALAISLSG